MPLTKKQTAIVLISLFELVFSSGCTNWKKKYEALNVEHQNLRK